MIRSCSPQAPDDVVAEAPTATPADVSSARAKAVIAGADWKIVPAANRSQALTAAADALAAGTEDLVDLIVREVGKPRREAAAEVARGVGILRFYAQSCLDPFGETLPGATRGSLILTMRRPHGVAGLITPWNFPLAIPLWKAAPALACGNSVLWKPSSAALGVAMQLARVLNAALPPAVLTLLAGGAETANALIDSVDVVSFTGSTAAGRSVTARAAGRGIPVQAEMGGANCAVLTPSADLGAAARHITAAAFSYAGQKCTATSHILIVGQPGPAHEALAKAANDLTVGDPADAATDSGPLIDSQAAGACQRAWEQARERGARLVAAIGDRSDGAWQPLRLVADVPRSTSLSCQEVFGPIATVQSVESLDHAISVITSRPDGLVSGLHTTDLAEALSFSRRVTTGMVKINAATTGVDFWAPFGGDKDSSYGPREQGHTATHFYASSQTVTLDGLE